MSCAVIKLLIIFNWATVPECQPPLPVIHVVLHLKKRGAESREGHVMAWILRSMARSSYLLLHMIRRV